MSPLWHPERLARQGNLRRFLWMAGPPLLFSTQALAQLHQPALEFAAQDGLRTKPAQVGGVDRRIKTIEAEMGLRIQGFHPLDHSHSQAGGGVHRNVKRHCISAAHGFCREGFHSAIGTGDRKAGFLEPGGR